MLNAVHGYWVRLVEFGDRWTAMNLSEVNNTVLHIYKAFFLTLKKEKQMSYAETIILLSTFGSFLYC